MEIKTIPVIGAGTMGRGIAYAAALGGYRTILEDGSHTVLDQALVWIKQSFDEGVVHKNVEASARDAALAQITTANDVNDAIRGEYDYAQKKTANLKKELI